MAAPGGEMMPALLIEIIFTFLLAFVVLQTATTKEQSGNGYYGFAIGIAVLVGAFAGGAISGGAFNTAVGLGPIIANGFAGASHWWLYIVGPMIGGALAAGLFTVVNSPEKKKK
jgi:aquaporin Z